MGNNWPDIVAEPGWGSASEVSYWGDLYRRALRADLQRAFSGATLPNIPEWDGSNFHHETNPDGAWGILTTSSDLSITFTGNIKEMVDATNGSTFLERLGWALEYHNFYFTPSGNTRTLNEFLSPYPECGGGQDGQSVTSTTNIVTTISFGH